MEGKQKSSVKTDDKDDLSQYLKEQPKIVSLEKKCCFPLDFWLQLKKKQFSIFFYFFEIANDTEHIFYGRLIRYLILYDNALSKVATVRGFQSFYIHSFLDRFLTTSKDFRDFLFLFSRLSRLASKFWHIEIGKK